MSDWPERAWDRIIKDTDNNEEAIFGEFTDNDAVLVFPLGDSGLVEIAAYIEPKGAFGFSSGVVESVFMSRELFDKMTARYEEDDE